MRSRNRFRGGKKPKSKGSQHLRTYSFIITLALLALIVAASSIESRPKVERIPPNFMFSPQPWMVFVPARLHYVGYINFEKAYAIYKDVGLFGTANLVQLYQLNFTISPQDVIYEVDVQLLDTNTAVTLLRLHDFTLNILESKLANSLNLPSWSYGRYLIHGLLMRTPDQQKLTLGFLSLVDGNLLLSLDETAGKQEVQTILDQISSCAPSLFSNSTVQRAVFASGVTDLSYVGLFIGLFPSQLQGSVMIVKSIIPSENTILVTRSVLFPSQDAAQNQYGEARRVYSNARSYRILDSWLVISYQYTTDKLKGELTGI